MLNATGAEVPLPLLAVTVKFAVPAVVGVPEISPVSGSSVKPAGKLPAVTLQFIVPPPVAESVWLYAVPTVPFGSEVVVMDGADGEVTFITKYMI
jgi:hypothetical protein